MTSKLDKSLMFTSEDVVLNELLETVSDEAERQRIFRVWGALGRISGKELPPPVPSVELDRVLRMGHIDELLSDSDLYMVAAAGSQSGAVSGQGDPLAVWGKGESNALGGATGGFFAADSAVRSGQSARCVEGSDNMYQPSLAGSAHGSGRDGSAAGVLGEDSLDGGTKNSIFPDATGKELIPASMGGDTFIFGGSGGSNVISDFNPHEDRLLFHGLHSQNDLTVSVENGDTKIQFGMTSITVEGIEMTLEEVWACSLHEEM